MGLVKGFFGVDRHEITLTTEALGLIENTYYKTIATEASIALISKTLSRAEFQTFSKGKEIKEKDHYLLNIEANQNRSAPLFWREVISELLKNGEALVLMENRNLYLATEFTKEENVFKENVYKDIMIGDHEISGNRNESNVIYLKDDNEKINTAVEGLSNDFSKLAASSMKGYFNSKSRKGKVDIGGSYSQTLKDVEDLQEHFKGMFKDFLDPEKDAILPQQDGLDYTEISEAKGSKSNDSGRETKNFINDIFDFVAISYGIPPSLLKGDMADTKDAFNNFITFCINPLAEMIEDEINRKMYGLKEYKNKNYVRIDTTQIKVTDIKDLANSIELLTRNASNTVDDNLRLLGREPIGGEVGESRFVTANLIHVDTALNAGKENNQQNTSNE